MDVAAIIVCDRRGAAERWKHLRRWATRYGWVRATSQVLARLVYAALRGRDDARRQRGLVDDAANRATIAAAGVPLLRTTSYSAPATLEAIRAAAPEFLVVHSPYIVGRKVRALASVATIGGHPGITPDFRGSYSAFWALALGRPEMVGWTVFELDDGIDTGPVLAQGRLPVQGESHMVLTWRGMMAEAEAQAALIRRYATGQALEARPVGPVDDSSYFGPPTLRDLLRYVIARRRAARR